MMSLPSFVAVGLLALSANLVASNQHDTSGPAWERRRNEMTKGRDVLDWSRDPRRVDAKVYDQYENRTDRNRYSWTYAFTGQLEGQEFPAGLLKGDRVVPKSKGQAAVCTDMSRLVQPTGVWWDRLQDSYRGYLSTNGILLETDLPMEWRAEWKCAANKETCNTYMLKDPWNPDTLAGDLAGSLSDAVERVLDFYGPVMFETNMDIHGNDIDANCFRTKCEHKTDPNNQHNILLVGYGITDDGEKYFKYKNSLGPHWGHNGYGYIKYNRELKAGTCDLPGTIYLWGLKPCRQSRMSRHRHGKHG